MGVSGKVLVLDGEKTWESVEQIAPTEYPQTYTI